MLHRHVGSKYIMYVVTLCGHFWAMLPDVRDILRNEQPNKLWLFSLEKKCLSLGYYQKLIKSKVTCRKWIGNNSSLSCLTGHQADCEVAHSECTTFRDQRSSYLVAWLLVVIVFSYSKTVGVGFFITYTVFLDKVIHNIWVTIMSFE